MEEKKQKATTKIVTGVVIVSGATSFLVGTGLQFTPKKASTELKHFIATSTEESISYEVEIALDESKSFYIRLYNQFTERKEEIKSGEYVTGSFLNLAKHMNYKISVYEDDIAMKTISISTYI